MKNQTIRRIVKMLSPHKKAIIIISILAIIISIGEVINPYLMKIVIDDYLKYGIYEKASITIGKIGILYIVITFVNNILNYIVTTATSILGQNVVYTLRNKLFKHIQYANITFHDKTPAGKLFVRITNDVEDITSLFKDVVTNLVKDIIMIVVLITIMITIKWQLALFVLSIVPFIILTSYLLTKASKSLREYSKKARTELNTFLAESIYGIKLIKIFNRQYEKQKECQKYTKKVYKSRLPIAKIEGLLPGIMLILQNLGVALIVCCIANRWFGISADVGVVYLFTTYIKDIFDPINRIVENYETVQESIVSINKIYDILENKECLENFEEGKILDKVEGKIEFKNVWFAYKNEDWILKDVSFEINPGESIALVGKTGSGKTTITNLINRFYDIQKGEILLDGVNIKNINLRSLRKNIGIILQDPFIFAKSIKENIELDEKLSNKEVEEAISLSSANEFVNSLPNGIEELSKERGSSYSAGQKQLLAFARIFAHKPKIFILDEATANIDTHTEKLIQKSIDKISKDKTSIFIAHRLSTIINVDKIIVLDNGQIIEQGNHNQLLKNEDGYYAKLYNAYYTNLVT